MAFGANPLSQYLPLALTIAQAANGNTPAPSATGTNSPNLPPPTSILGAQFPPGQVPNTTQVAAAPQPPKQAVPQPVGTTNPSDAAAAAQPTTMQTLQDKMNADQAKYQQDVSVEQWNPPQYQAPNKWQMLAALLAGLAFPGSNFSRLAAGFGAGLQQGAENKYERGLQAAKDQYAAEQQKTLDDEKMYGMDVTRIDAEEKAEDAREKERQRHSEFVQRMWLNTARFKQMVANQNWMHGYYKDRLNQQMEIAQMHIDTQVRGQDMSFAEHANTINAEMARTQFTTMATNQRWAGNMQMRNLVIQSTQAKQNFDAAVKNAMKQTDQATRQQMLDQAGQDYNNTITGIVDQGAQVAPGTDFGHLSGMMTQLNTGVQQDEIQHNQTQPGYPPYAGGGAGMPNININVNPNGYNQFPSDSNAQNGGSGNANPSGNSLPWWNKPIPGGAGPNNQGAEQPQFPGASHAQREAEAEQSYKQNLAKMSGFTGPHLNDATMKNIKGIVQQHATSITSPEQLTQMIMSANPESAYISPEQGAELIELWAHTRRAAGESVPDSVPTPPGQGAPPAPKGVSGLPLTGSGAGGLDITKPGLGLTPGTTGPSAVKSSPNTPTHAMATPEAIHTASAMATPSVGEVVTHMAGEYQIPWQLLAAVIQHESGGNATAHSPAGAYGYGQLMPDTAHDLGVDRTVPFQNIMGAAEQLHFLLKKYHSIPLALAAYNAGAGAVDAARGVPNNAETRAYVPAVLKLYRNLMATSQANGNF
jgi:hypothetical protein